MSSFDPTPDTGAYPDPRVAVPDEHTALRLLRRMVADDLDNSIYEWPTEGCGRMSWQIAATVDDLSAAELDLLHRLTQQENPNA